MPDNLFDKLVGSGLKPSSAKRYVSVYKRVGSLDTDTVKQFIDGKKSATSMLACIVSCCRHDGNPEQADILAGLLKSMMETRGTEYVRPTEQQVADTEACPWSKIQSLESEYTPKVKSGDASYKDFLHWIVIRLMSEEYALRSQDFFTTVISTDDDEDENTLNLETGEWKIRHFKTDGKYPMRTLQVDAETCDLIKESREKFRVVSNRLITQIMDNGKPCDTAYFSKFLRRSPLGVGTTAIRNVYVSHQVDSGCDAEKREEMAKTMGHSLATQHTTYSKQSRTLDLANIRIPEEKDDLTTLLKQAIEKQGHENVKMMLQMLVS